MLLRAVVAVANGKHVVVVCGHRGELMSMRCMVADAGLNPDCIRFVALDDIRYRLAGLHRATCAVFVDHHARDRATIEQREELYYAKLRGLVHE